MSRIFRVDFYPHEWLTLTSHMPPEQKGIFIDICAMIYARRGPIKNDPAHIARAANCSSRLVRSVISQLCSQGDLQLVDGGEFITQKRCESELNLKRTHLEHSANGGRTAAEKRRECKNNNDIKSRGELYPQHTSPHPTPSSNNNLPLSTTPRDAGGGGFENGFGGKVFDVMLLLSDAGREAARQAADGWDIYYLAGIYNESVKRMGKPRNVNAAFPAWCANYTKGKKP